MATEGREAGAPECCPLCGCEAFLQWENWATDEWYWRPSARPMGLPHSRIREAMGRSSAHAVFECMGCHEVLT